MHLEIEIELLQLWTVYLYVSTFQQNLYMEYISLSWSYIPEIVVPIMMFLIGFTANKEATKPRVPSS
jgi:hypothetical protein